MINELMEKCGLGTVKGDITAVSGGLMHKMFRAETDKGIFAVKKLNPAIMKRPEAMGNFRKAEELERILGEHGLPIVAALPFQGRKMQELHGEYFYIFKWQNGSITDQDSITEKQCFIAGKLLGKIHSIDIRPAETGEKELCDIDLDDYVNMAMDIDPEIAGLLSDNLSMLKKAQSALNEARKSLPPIICITNDDMDPKNIMWYENEPHIIDLECLGHGNPYSSCIELSMQWAGVSSGRFVRQHLVSFFKGYLEEFSCGDFDYSSIYGIAYSWLEWLEYNIRRALGIEGGDAAERTVGCEEVKNTIGRIRYTFDQEQIICDVLRNDIIEYYKKETEKYNA